MNPADDTIAAIATAGGRAAIGVLRLSGPAAEAVGRRLAGALPPPRTAGLRTLRDADGEAVDRGLVLWFPAPRSYTGEPMIELHTHGSPVVLTALLEAACRLGARPARPGEFTERAFLNDRLDLAQAEAVADLIDAGSRAAARAALRAMEGELSRRVADLAEQALALRAWVEGALDFADEDVDWLTDEGLRVRLEALAAALEETQAATARGRRLRDGLRAVIAGRPNVGKSTLLNALVGVDAAIVTDAPGTTRDLLRESVVFDGVALELCDTAGLRDTVEPVEAEGVRRAWTALEAADLVLFVVEDADPLDQADRELLDRLPPVERLLVFNKCDRHGRPPGPFQSPLGPAVRLSATTGVGLEGVRAALRQRVASDAGDAGLFTARARQVDALRRAAEHLQAAREALSGGASAEVAAEELAVMHRALGEVTGAVGVEQLLDKIFSSFCIGK